MMKSLLISCLLLLSAGTAVADTMCAGKVNGVYVNQSGDLAINPDWGQGWIVLCNVNQSRFGTTVSACKSWQAQAMMALATKLTAEVFYAGPTYTCNQVPTSSNSPDPAFFLVTN
ncbi:hypothetical protein [Andreprevotia chitinilytica]|uniref:hypothetical protein n=1 Tax=Andreprevotia chitinilytica TaxID=396808 RepID=UPI000552FAB7|nr:hypothetical protein [Andreprevotia chitinilytica]